MEKVMTQKAAHKETEENVMEEELETAPEPEEKEESAEELAAQSGEGDVSDEQGDSLAEEGTDDQAGDDAKEGDKEMISHLKGKIKENEDKYLRLVAEFENFKRRSSQETQKRFKFASQGLALNIIEGIDSLELAVQHAKDDESEQMQEFVSGIEMVKQQLFDALKKSNIERIYPLDEAFDPNKHEALGVVASEKIKPGNIAAVFKAGYVYHERVIRPAAVQVVKND